jgi:hypothetical protein
MKCLKAFGMAIALAAALVACAGVGTSSATVLCKATQTPCAESNRIGAKSLISADARPGTLRFETIEGFLLSECAEGGFTGEVLNAGGATATVTTGATLSFGGCTGAVSMVHSGEFEIHHISGTDNGTLTARGVLPMLEIKLFSCTYYLPPAQHVGVVTGSAISPQVDVQTWLNYASGSGCFEHIVWKTTYAITKPSPLYVGAS